MEDKLYLAKVLQTFPSTTDYHFVRAPDIETAKRAVEKDYHPIPVRVFIKNEIHHSLLKEIDSLN